MECPVTTTTTTTTTHILNNFRCRPGQGEAWKKPVKETGDNSKESCAQRCKEEWQCHGFDVTTDGSSSHYIATSNTWQRDACRLYGDNKVREGDQGKSGRVYCSRLDEA